MHGTYWTRTLRALYDKAACAYGEGVRSADALFSPSEVAQLALIGARPIEIYDYVEDRPSVDWETALLILAIRREYFLDVQNGVLSQPCLTRADFPAKSDALEGIKYLPRLILKAQCRLRGELPFDLMYGCGSDRRFFSERDLHPADFLRFCWKVNGDPAAILAFLCDHAASQSSAEEGDACPLIL